MANYMDSMTSLSNVSLTIPENQCLCLVLGLVGFVCMAWGLSIVMRTAQPAVVEIEPERE